MWLQPEAQIMDRTILLVDDEEDIRDVLGMSLSDMGYQVHTAENGEQGYRLYLDIRPSIVLTDIKMPGMDGIELLRKIKQDNPETEVIMITGHGDMDLAITSFKDEASDFITKPIDVDALEIALQRVREKIVVRQKLREYTEGLESQLMCKTVALRRMEETVSAEPPEKAEWSIQDRFQDHFDMLPCYITVHDCELKFVSMNSRFVEDFGDELGSHCYTVLKQRAAPCAECPVMQTFEDGKSHQMEMEFIAKSSRRYNVMVWTSPIRDSSGKIYQVLVMATNLDQVMDLQNHLSSLGLMIGSVSHGIKGLLTGLDGGMYLLDSGFSKKDETKMREGLDITKKMVGQIRNLVLDILFYAKERELKCETVDLESFATEVSAVVASKMEKQGIDFRAVLNNPLRSVDMDPGFMQTALVNVLENAIDACAENKSRETHVIEFSVSQNDSHVHFSVSDNGIGMDRQTRENMFELFFSAKGKQGTGLGLFITKKVVSQHGGSIHVESEKGKGTTITIILPNNPPPLRC
jgi:FixJ family two-component response regulator/nitrogen-specific signal transduction histidine kinase